MNTKMLTPVFFIDLFVVVSSLVDFLVLFNRGDYIASLGWLVAAFGFIEASIYEHRMNRIKRTIESKGLQRWP